METPTVEHLAQLYGIDLALAAFILSFEDDAHNSDIIEIGPDGQERPAPPGIGLFDDDPPAGPRLVVPVNRGIQ
jgi:hypothetical protein